MRSTPSDAAIPVTAGHEAGRRRPTMNDVAAASGVSLKTVSRVVNGVSTVDEQLVEKVLAAIRELGFRRNDVAASLRSGRSTATVGLIIGDISNSFYSTIAAAVADVARSFTTQLITASSEEQVDRERELALDLSQRRVDGLVITPATGDQGYLRAEIEMGIPVVFVDRPPVGITADAVLLDNRGGARDATKALISAGHRRIGVVLDSLEIFTMRERLAGVRDALQEAGLSFDESLLRTTAHDPGASREAAASLLDGSSAPTAYFTGNNRATVGVVDELWRRDAHAAIAGFDDFELSGFLPRRVTIVDSDTAALGALAAQRLFERIAGKAGEARTTLLPTRLVTRGSDR